MKQKNGGWELGAGSWELGAQGWELGAGAGSWHLGELGRVGFPGILEEVGELNIVIWEIDHL